MILRWKVSHLFLPSRHVFFLSFFFGLIFVAESSLFPWKRTEPDELSYLRCGVRTVCVCVCVIGSKEKAGW